MRNNRPFQTALTILFLTGVPCLWADSSQTVGPTQAILEYTDAAGSLAYTWTAPPLAAFASDAIVLGRGRLLALDERNEKSGVRNAAGERVGQSGGCSAKRQLKGQAAVHDATSRENRAGPGDRQFLFHCADREHAGRLWVAKLRGYHSQLATQRV